MSRKFFLWIIPILILLPLLVEARVTELVIRSVESPIFEGTSFGDVGQYERLTGFVKGELDPADPLNKDIVNIQKAPRNAQGLVEYETEIYILKPVELNKGNDRIFYELSNRAMKLGLNLINDIPFNKINDPYLAEDAGNGFLMREGYTVIYSGWQMRYPIAGVTTEAFPYPISGPGGIFARFPIATDNGNPIIGLSREEFIDESGKATLASNLSYPAANLDPKQATLTVREKQTDPRQALTSWRYLNSLKIEITRPGPPFDAGSIYEFIYPAKNPVVYGMSYASVRDVLSFFRYEASDDQDRLNPLAPAGSSAIEKVIVMGNSQTGRYLRNLIYEGFTIDEKGRQVMDGAIPVIAGARLNWTNYEFALPGVWSRQHFTHFQPGDQFPFTYGVLKDPVSGKTDGILKKCQASGSCPKIMHTDTDTEFWEARASLVVTDTRGNDITLPNNVRAYLFSGTQHAPAWPGELEWCQNSLNPLDYRPLSRAVVVAMNDWISDGIKPPDSNFPTNSENTLVPPAQSGFPQIPGANYTGQINALRLVDYTVQPPVEGADYPILVSRVDSDGNGVAGIRLPDVEVPIATYAGWNIRSSGHAEGDLCDGYGSSIPFAKTKAERIASGDPRLSLEERYKSHDDYVEKVSDAANDLVRKRFLLEEDAERIVKKALEINFIP